MIKRILSPVCRRGKSGFITVLLVFTALSVFPGSARPESVPAVIDTVRFIEDSCLNYATAFTLKVSPAVWERVVDSPYLFGKLWERYGFEPPYRLVRWGSVIHLIDPTGLEGDLFTVSADDSTRVFCGDGRMKNWGIPFGVRGRALFVLTYTAGEESVDARLRIFGEGTGTFTDIIIKMCSPILKYYINRRITGNLRDANVILADIALRPAEIRSMLDDGLRREFDDMLAGLDSTGRK